MISLTKRSWAIAAAVAVALGFAAFSASSAKPAKPAKAPPLVSFTRAQTRDLPVQFTVQGHLAALHQVDVRALRTGSIRSVHFREGDDVEAGQLLFTLDAADAAAQHNRAQAQVAQIKAQLDDAQRDYVRSKELMASNFLSASAVDTSASKVDALKAQYRAAVADVEGMRVQLERTRIVAPITGKAGPVKVYRGSLADSGTTPLVTLMQFDPIGVEFNLPESQLAAVVAARTAGTLKVTLDAGDGREVPGQISFINNTVNTSTGSVAMKGSFPNKDQALWPGAFVRVTLNAGVSKGAIVLPPQAVLEGPDGNFVFVVTPQSVATTKPVKLLRLQDRLAVVEGLADGERVVLEGNQNLAPGMPVAEQDVPSADRPATPKAASARASS